MPPKLTPENIRELTNEFCMTFKKISGKPRDLKGLTVGLKKGDGYWDLVAGIYSKAELKAFTATVEIPDDLAEKPLNDALIDLAGLISTRLSYAARAVNQNLGRTDAERHATAVRAGKNRWKKKENNRIAD